MSTTATQTPGPQESAAQSRGWLGIAEKGSVLGIRFVVFLATVFGRTFASLFLRVVALYYVTFHPSVRRSLRAYYLQLDGRRPGFVALWRHVFGFARVALDRLFFAQGKRHLFSVTFTGREHIAAAVASGRGAILLTAHLGSQAAMGADASSPRLNIVGYFRNARRINEVLGRFDPQGRARVIHIDPGSVSSVLAIKECVERGELVVVAADRIGLNERTVAVDFLGRPARFPAGPFVLASVLRCPILLAFALYRGGRRYDLYCELFSQGIDAPRGRRDAVIAAHAQRYADRLASFCHMAPDNWYNFYDFWGSA